MQATDIPARVGRAIDDLGGDPDTIADRLRQLGIKGVRKHDCKCVLAVYLQRALDEHWVIEVLETGVTVHAWDGVGEPIVVEVPLPEHAMFFVLRFDRGIYPDLVEGGDL